MQKNEIVSILGKSIGTRRRALDITQADLAEQLDIASDTMSRIENGRFAPKMSRLFDIANALNCNVSDLFRDADENVTDRATAITKLLKPLPEESQEVLLNLLMHAVKVLQK